jgi:hypothetical protein
MRVHPRRTFLAAMLAWLVTAPAGAQRYGRRRGQTNREKNRERERERQRNNEAYPRYLELIEEGHIRRHTPLVTMEQLEARVRRGIDPLTGTRRDGVSGRRHRKPGKASQFNSPAAMVRADNWLRGSRDFARAARAELDLATKSNRQPEHINVVASLREALGPGYADMVRGVGKKGLLDYRPGGWIHGWFYFENGRWKTETIYPEPLAS